MKRKLCTVIKRNEKTLTFLAYIFLLIFSCYAIYDPVTVLGLMFPTSMDMNNNDNIIDKVNRKPFTLPEKKLEYYLNLYYNYTTTEKTPGELRYIDIPFIPKSHYCDDIFEKSGANFSYSEFYLDHMDAYKSVLSSVHKLSAADVNEQSWAFHMLAQMDFVKTVCEAGFNAGHNTFHWLTAKPEVNVIAFESQINTWVEDLGIFMQAEFPDHFELHQGPAVQQIRSYKQNHNKTKCHIVYVDSSQRENDIFSEIDEFKEIVSKTENLLVMDSHGKQSKKIWKKLKSRNIIKEHFRCIFRDTDGNDVQKQAHFSAGFFIGSYIF